jgi:hypothetical protein
MNQSQIKISMPVVKERFFLALSLCKTLKLVNFHLAITCRHVRTVLSRTTEMRENASTAFSSILNEAQRFAIALGLGITPPRTRGGRSGHPNDPDLLAYYRTSIIPFPDNFISQLKNTS